jgi:LysM repeat protein
MPANAQATTPTTETTIPIPIDSVTTQATTEPVAQSQPTTQATTAPTTQESAAGDAAIAEGTAKLKAEEFLAGRKIFNNALLSGTLGPNQTATVKQLLSQANQTIVFSTRHFPDDPYGGTVTVQSGQTLAKIAQTYAVPWQFLLQINGLSNPKYLRADQTLKIIKGPFNAVVTKSAFTMDIWLGTPEQQGSMYITTYRVGLGQDDSTPTGTWMVEPSRKLRNPTYFSPRGQGIIEADDPKNPLGKYWIGLTGTEGQAVGKMSYGIHGTIDPSSIGHMSSLGCIRLGDADIAQVFAMLVEGKSVVIVRK